MPTLYLTSTATSSPFPTTSRLLSETNNASEVQLGPGEFDSGLPGTTDCGQWNPNSAIADTIAAAEIDNTGASLGTTRQGWLWDVDLTGKAIQAGTWSVQLRLRANQGTGTLGRILMRVTVVTGSSGAWTTVANLLTTAITGEASHTTGQNGWRAQTTARITVTSTAANFAVDIAASGTSTAHTFASGERLLIELGFGDGDSTTDRTWRLDYNTANSFVTTPALETLGTLDETLGALTSSAAGTVDVAGSANPTLGALTSSSAGTVDVVGATNATLGALTLSGTGTVGELESIGTLNAILGALTGSSTGTVDVSGAASSTLGALTSAAVGTVTVQGATSYTLGTLTSTAGGTVAVAGTATATLGAVTTVAAGGVAVAGALARTLAALTVIGAGGGEEEHTNATWSVRHQSRRRVPWLV